MTKTALKKKIIKSIENLENEKLLTEVMKIITLYSDMDEIVKLSPQQKKAIQRSTDDIKKGRIYTNAQVNKEIEKWLKD